MGIYVTKKTESRELKELMIEAWSSGKRYVLQSSDGISAAIVSMEDLKVLEQVDGNFSNSLSNDCT